MGAVNDLLNEYKQSVAAPRVAPPRILQGNFSGGKDAAAPKLNWIQKNLNAIGGGGGAIAGATAGAAIGSVVPVAGTAIGGLLGALIGAAGGGAAGEAAKQGYEGNAGTKQAGNEIRKQALIQGGLGLAGEGVGQAAKLISPAAKAAVDTGSQGGLLAKIGGGLRQDVMNPVVKASPTGAAQETTITSAANKLLPKGSAAAKYSAMPRTMEQLGNQLDTVLANNTAAIPAHDITAGLQPLLSDATKFPTTDQAFTKAVDKHLSNILAAGAQNGGELTAADVASLRQGLQDTAFKGGAMTPQKQAAQAVWAHLGDTLQQVAPEAKSIISMQGDLYKAAPGLAKNADKSLGVPMLGVKSKTAARAVQAGKDAAGSVLQGTSGLMGKAGKLASNRAVDQVAVRAGANALNPDKPVADQTATDTSNSLTTPDQTATDQGATTDQNPNAFSPEMLQALAVHDIQATGGKNLDKIATLDKLFGSGSAANKAKKLSTTDQARSDALKSAMASLDSAGQNLTSAGGAQGPKGELANVPWLGKYLDPQGAAYHNTKIEMATALAKAVTGGSRPASSVIDKYMHSLPDVNDNPAYAQSKIDKLRNELLSQAKAFGFTDLTNNQ